MARARDEVAGPALVGRAHEVRRLHAAIDRGATILVRGARGLGKSRLVAEVAAQRDEPVVWGRSWEAATTTPYLPWQQAATGLRRLCDPEQLNLALSGALGGILPGQSSAGEANADVVAMAMYEFLHALAAELGTAPVVVLEDMHRADEESLRLLVALASAHPPCPLVVTTRPFEDASTARQHTLRGIASCGEVLDLVGLDDTTAGNWLRSVAPEAQPDDVEAAVHAAGGVPLHLVQLADALATGHPERGLDELIGGRLDRMDPSALAALEVACVLGDHVATGTVAAVLDVDRLEATARLDAAAVSGLIVEDRELGQYRFVHAAYREAIDRTLSSPRRLSLHAAALQALSDRFVDRPDASLANRLADHATAARAVAGDVPALRWGLAAAQHALDAGAPLSALERLERGAAILTLPDSTVDADTRRELLLTLGATRVLLGREAQHAPLDGLCEEAIEHRDTELLRAVGLASVPPISPQSLGAEPDLRTIRRLRAVHERLRDGDPARGQIAGALGVLDYTADGMRHLDERVAEAERSAADHGDRRLAARAAVARAGGQRLPGTAGAMLERVDAALGALGDDIGDEYLSLVSVRMTLLWRLGRFDRVRRELGRLHALGRSVPSLAQWVILRWRTTLSLLDGDYALAEKLLVRSHDAGVRAGRPDDAASYFALQASMLSRDRGDDVTDMVRGWLDAEPDSPLVQALSAWALADLGSDDEAVALVGRAAPRILADPTVPQYHPALMAALLVAGWNEHADLARELVEAALPYRDEWCVLGSGLIVFGPVALCAAVGASGAGDVDLADQLFAEATERAQHSGSAPAVAHCHLEAARHLRRIGDARAAARFADAAERFAALALPERARRCRAAATDARETGRSGANEPTATQPAGEVGTFRRNDDVWIVEFGGVTSSVVHRKGYDVLAMVLQRPDTMIPALDLARALDGSERGAPADVSTQHVIDEAASKAYRERAVALADEIVAAREAGDEQTVTTARRELEAIEEHLRVGMAVGGTSRRFTDDHERARSRVTKLLRSAIAQLADVDPVLGDHLHRSVTTGHACGYVPDRRHPVHWTVHRRG